MSFVLTGAVTGAAQTGLTTPGYTLTADTPPDVNSKQSAITALTGTQTGVTLHSASSPFTVTVRRPKQLGVLGKPNPITGLVSVVPRNTYAVLGRKGVTPLAGQPIQIMTYKQEISVPAGAETYDNINCRALLSFCIGFTNTNSSGLGDTIQNAILG